MKELRQLVSYVNPTRLRRLNFYKGSGKGADSQIKRLYQAIHKGKVSTDEEAVRSLFKDSKGANYSKVKYRLKEQLINTALLIEKGSNESDPYDFIFIDCRRKLFVAEVLRKSGAIHAAFSIAKKGLKQAESAGISDIACRCCDIIVSYYSFVKRAPSKRKEYIDRAADWHHKHKADYDAKLVYDYYLGFFINDTSYPAELESELADSVKGLKHAYPEVDSVDYNYCLGFLEMMFAMIRAKYDEVVEICQRQIALLESRHVFPLTYERNFLLQIISVSISTDNFEAGTKAVKRFLAVVPAGSRPWFRTHQLYIQLALTNKKYQLAVDLVDEVSNLRSFRGLAEDVRERIILLKAYVYWLGALELIEDKGQNFSKFRLAKFLNSVPEFAKDKQGLNIPILVVQALWLLHRKQYERVRDRLTALKRYADRYLKNAKGTKRTYYFVKAFSQLAEANFQRNGFLRISEKNLELLKSNPRSKVEQNAEIEIIPYEHLYKLVSDQLDLKLHY